jgi:hypothetical protein
LNHLSVFASDGGDELAIGATSSAPALYRLRAQGGSFSMIRRPRLPTFWCDAYCPGGDDVAFTSNGYVVMNVRGCRDVITLVEWADSFGWTQGDWIYASASCMPYAAQNTVLYSAPRDRFYLVFGGSQGPQPAAMPFSDASSHGTARVAGWIAGFAGTPEAGAITADGRQLLVVKQQGCLSPFQLDRYDTMADQLTSGVYVFTTSSSSRLPVGARVVTLGGGLPGMSGSMTQRLGTTLGSAGFQLGLVVFGLVLWRFDRRRGRA